MHWDVAGNEAVISQMWIAWQPMGICFCNAYTAAPSSTPARAGIL